MQNFPQRGKSTLFPVGLGTLILVRTNIGDLWNARRGRPLGSPDVRRMRPSRGAEPTETGRRERVHLPLWSAVGPGREPRPTPCCFHMSTGHLPVVPDSSTPSDWTIKSQHCELAFIVFGHDRNRNLAVNSHPSWALLSPLPPARLRLSTSTSVTGRTGRPRHRGNTSAGFSYSRNASSVSQCRNGNHRRVIHDPAIGSGTALLRTIQLLPVITNMNLVPV